jgi:hypothetical protein
VATVAAELKAARDIDATQKYHREGAKKRSCAKNYQPNFAKLRFFAASR